MGSTDRVRIVKGELSDLEVERVDGVDRPATRRRFIITKAEGDAPAGAAGATDDAASLANAKKALAAAARALGAVHASKAEFEGTVADDLNELAEAAGVEVRFTKAAATAPAFDLNTAAGAEGFANMIAKAVGSSVGVEIRKALDEAVPTEEDLEAVGKGEPIVLNPAAAAAPPPSSQPAGQTGIEKRVPIEKVGDGVFANIVFGH